MWSPSDVVVTVKQAKNLLIKAKGGVNDAYATIELLKEKYATAPEKSLSPKWFTECTFALPAGGVLSSKVVVIVTVYHKRHGKLGLEPDEFIGQIHIPLSSLNSNDDQTRSTWHKLKGKKKDSKKERGEIEIGFRFLTLNKNAVLPEKKVPSSPRSLRVLTSGIRNKLRRRSEDEDSGVGSSDGDRNFSLGKGRSYENLATSSVIDSQNKPFERNFYIDSTNSSPGALHSARGSARLANATNSLPANKAMSVEVLNIPVIKSESSLRRSNSGGGGGNLVQRMKKHTRNRSMPTYQLATMMGRLHKDDEVSKSAVCVNGSHLYVPGASAAGSSTITNSQGMKARSSSLTNVNGDSKSKPVKPTIVVNNDSSRRSSATELDVSKNQRGSILPTLYKPKNYYRLDVKELCKVSTIPEDINASLRTMTHEDLVKLASGQSDMITRRDKEIKELEDYIDSLLLKVMVSTPQILEDSFRVCR